MEDIKQKIVLPTKGVCNSTPDPICDDTEMEDCVGLTYSDDAIRPIQDVAELFSCSGKLMFVHEINTGEKHYIFSDKDKNNVDILKAYKWDGETLTYLTWDGKSSWMMPVTSIKSVGNTLIMNTVDGLYYFLWSQDTYKYLGNNIPAPVVSFRPLMGNPYSAAFNSNGLAEGDTKSGTANTYFLYVKVDHHDDFEEGYLGTYADLKNQIAEKGQFFNPFFIRYALELYDGSYTYISAPVLIYPRGGEDLYWLNSGMDKEINPKVIKALSWSTILYVTQSQDYSDFSDIVTGVTLFVTDSVDRWTYTRNSVGTEDFWEWFSFAYDGITSIDFYHYDYGNVAHYNRDVTSNARFYFHLTSLRDRADVLKDLKQRSTFFKLCDIGKNKVDSVDVATFIPTNGLKNILTRPTLEYDDFYGYTTLYPSMMETFNRRLNLMNVSRSFFDGFLNFHNVGDGYATRTIYVRIKTPSGNKIVMTSGKTYASIENGYWFFYPDTRANHVWVFLNGVCKLSEDLTEHDGLNGSYLMKAIPPDDGVVNIPDDVLLSEDPVVSNEPETLQNFVLQSGVDNPFYFNSSSYIRVGQGMILGMAGLTTALNQDAYKVATTIVFTTQGIWALQVSDDGSYKSVTPPFSREIVSNPKSITMVDNGVFYVSKKGLMCINDEYGNKCVSSQLCGKDAPDYDSFIDFIQECTMAYDYRDSQLWLTNSNYDYHWVYNIKSGTLTRKTDGHIYKSIVVDFPDTLLQADSDIYTMYNEPNINKDETVYNGTFITRPMKFEQAMALKSLRDLKHIKDLNADATINLTIYASNDCVSWQALSSLRGRGFKYYKFKYEFTNLKAYDAFCGTVLYYTTRLTDRLR